MSDYSKQDFVDIYEDLLSIVESSPTSWQPRNSTEADPGVVILKLIALLEDKNGYRTDMARAQDYLDTVTDRDSAFELLSMLGYQMKQARAASGTVNLLVAKDTANIANGVIKAFSTKFTDSTKSLKFFLTQDVALPSSLTSGARLIAHVQAGEPFQVTKEGFDYFTLKDIDEDGRLYLGYTGLAQNGIFVLSESEDDDSAAVTWEYLDFVILKPSTRWYTVSTADTGEMYIQFPDNFTELIGSSKLRVWATYTTGSETNIGRRVLNTISDITIETSSTPVTDASYFSVEQTAAFYTGQDAETIEDARANYYRTKDVCNSLVTAEDFEIAIRNLVCSFTGLDEGTHHFRSKGDKYFTNASIFTAQDRMLNIRTRYHGVSYNTFVSDSENTTKDNEIEVLALGPSDADDVGSYVESFQRIETPKDDDDNSDKNSDNVVPYIENDAQYQLRNNRAAHAVIKIASSEQIPRILAVTTPEVTLRVSNYSDALASQLRQKVLNYFYTTYRADMIDAGEPFDVQRMMDDIKKLSPEILSVTIPELEYKMYTKYVDVDGKSEALDSESNEAIRNKIIRDSILAGDVPLFRYANRQNTITKSTSVYQTLASVDSALESVTPVPFNSTEFARANDGKAYAPEIKGFKLNQDGAVKELPLSNPNQALQFRKPVRQNATSIGFGMQYKFERHLPVSGTLESGVVAAAGSHFTEGTTLEFTDAYDVTELKQKGLIEGDGGAQTKITVAKAFSCSTSMSLKAGTGTVFQDGSYLNYGSSNYSPDPVADGAEYCLKDGELLTIENSQGIKSSEYTAGQYIKPSGLTLQATTSPITLQSMQTIAPQEEVSTDITTDFKYFMSLRAASGNFYFDETGSYMLEEGEYFLYSDKAVSEYMTLGPGTVLKLSNANWPLYNTSSTELQDVLQSNFRDVPAAITAYSYEFTTFRGQSDNITVTWADTEGKNTEDTVDPGKISWESISEDRRMRLVQSGAQLGLFGSDYEYRFCLVLESAANGACPVYFPCSVTLSSPAEDRGEITIAGTGGDGQGETRGLLVSSTPFTGVLAGGSVNKPLLPAGVTATISTGRYQSSAQGGGSTTGGFTEAYLTVGSRSDMDFAVIDKVPHYTMFRVSLANQEAISALEGTLKITGSGSEFSFYLTPTTSTTTTLSYTINGQFPADLLVCFNSEAEDKNTLSFSWAKSGEGPETIDLVLTDLSYIQSYASELALDKDTFNGFTDGIAKQISDVNGRSGNQFDWLAYPTENYSDPLAAESFFEQSHPYHRNVFAFIKYSSSKIKVIRGR